MCCYLTSLHIPLFLFVLLLIIPSRAVIVSASKSLWCKLSHFFRGEPTCSKKMEKTNGNRKIYKLVLTGGPCSGKSAGQLKLANFFKNIGWKVFCVPDTTSIYFNGGMQFNNLSEKDVYVLRLHILKTTLEIENTFFDFAESCSQNCLIICDGGVMDSSAFVTKDTWVKILTENKWNNNLLRDNRYDHIIHLVSAANGAEVFYTIDKQTSDFEGIELAKLLDRSVVAAWTGHPNLDIIDNSTNFDEKLQRMLKLVCYQLNIDTKDSKLVNSKHYKFLVKGPLPDVSCFQWFEDIDIVYNYICADPPNQIRLKKYGQKGCFTYTHTVLKPVKNSFFSEVNTKISRHDYLKFLSQKDESHFTIYKRRRCFFFNNQYYQLDIYQTPCHSKCKGLIILKICTNLTRASLLKRLPVFLNIYKEVSESPRFSTSALALKTEF